MKTRQKIRKRIFVFAVCGDEHARRVNTSLKFLKKFTRHDILVLKSRSHIAIDCDNVIEVETPDWLDNHQASIFMKTNVHRLVGDLEHEYCYLDSDVVAVDPQIDTIFDERRGSVTFALDSHTNVDDFSPLTVNEGHLIDAIREKFGTEVTNKKWVNWNGGVFLFDRKSVDFMDNWHRFCLAIFKDTKWKTRDQGTLIATVWKFGLQNHRTLPEEFNLLVSPELKKRNKKYSLKRQPGKIYPYFLHFIDKSHGKRGWKCWDEVERIIDGKKVGGRMDKIKNMLNLSLSFAKAGFKQKNEGSYLGIFWYLLNPLLLFLLLLLVFSGRLGGNIPNYPLYLLTGIILFNLFQQATTECTKAMHENRWLIKAINFPRESIIGSIVLKALFSHVFEIILLLMFLLIFKTPLIGIVFYPIILIFFCFFVFGVSLILSSLTVYFVDLGNIWFFMSRLIWLGTPIFYAIGGQTKLFFINLFNPMYYFITIARDLIIYMKMPDWRIITGAIVYSLIFLIAGLFVFNKLKIKFAEMI